MEALGNSAFLQTRIIRTGRRLPFLLYPGLRTGGGRKENKGGMGIGYMVILDEKRKLRKINGIERL